MVRARRVGPVRPVDAAVIGHVYLWVWMLMMGMSVDVVLLFTGFSKEMFALSKG